MKRVLTIAGSDCSGGAGIQADIKTFSAHGVFGMSAIVSVVAENTARVIDIMDVTPDMIKKQIDAVYEDIGTDAVKVGMLSQPCCMAAVAEKLREYSPSNVVIDPVMYAKNGCPLMDPGSIDALIETIIPLADLLTPNIPEAEKISGIEIHSTADMERAAKPFVIWVVNMCSSRAAMPPTTRSTCFMTVCSSTAFLRRASTQKTRTVPAAPIRRPSPQILRLDTICPRLSRAPSTMSQPRSHMRSRLAKAAARHIIFGSCTNMACQIRPFNEMRACPY